MYHVGGAGVMWVQSLGAVTSRTLQPGEEWIGASMHAYMPGVLFMLTVD